MSEAIYWAALRAAHSALTHVPASLRQLARRDSFTQGDTIFRLGERPGAMIYLLSGELHLVRRSRDGTEIILQRTRGGFFAEASLESERYHCDAVASESGELLSFPAQAFSEALARDAAFRSGWIAHLAKEVRRLRAQCERLSLKGATERILHYIESEGSNGVVVLAQTKKTWAAELGMSHEALYRTLRRMREQGLIRVDGERVVLARDHD